MGYIFPDTTLDMMFERAVEEEWERQNESDSEKIFGAFTPMSRAVEKMREALNQMAEAVDQLEGTASYDKVMSLMNDLENLECDAVRMRDKFEKGVNV